MMTIDIGDGKRKTKMYIMTATVFQPMRLARFFRAAATISTMFLLLAVAMPAPAGATPPSAVDLSFDKTAGILTVSITHVTADPSSHYIYKVEITKNGAAYGTSLYTSQPEPLRFTYYYNVTATDGDTIAVTATCIWYGYVTTTLNVTTGKTTSAAGGSSYSLWPYHAALMVTGVVLGALAISAVYMKKKPWWFRAHKLIAAGAAVLLISGVSVAAYMIAAAGGTQFRVLHAWVGITAVILVIALLALGMVFVYKVKLKRAARTPHLWTGRLTIALMVINIILGLGLVGLLVLG